MKIKQIISYLILMAFMPVFTLRADVYCHKETGIILPSEIAGHSIGEVHVFDKKELGESVSFYYQNSTATIYLYDSGRKDLKDDSGHKLIIEELSNVTEQIRAMQEAGRFENVDIGRKASVQGDGSSFALISVPASYNIVKNANSEEKVSSRQTHSLISVGIYNNHFIKIRYSFDHAKQDEVDKANEQRDAFIRNVRGCVLEANLKEDIGKNIQIYRENPYSNEAKAALAEIFTYAEESVLISISINQNDMPWMTLKYPYGTELLGAYIVGQVDYQISTNKFESNHKAGMQEALRVYQGLVAKDEKARIDSLDELAAKKVN
ncbi:hypothetical protein [Persicirhabdus sediminis]|nr:hypothetical protein [Persicirhabdus sediminis]